MDQTYTLIRCIFGPFIFAGRDVFLEELCSYLLFSVFFLYLKQNKCKSKKFMQIQLLL